MSAAPDSKSIFTHAFGSGADMTAVFCLASDTVAEDIPAIERIILPEIEKGTCRPFLLTWSGPVDWHRDYTPWPAPPLSAKNEPFAGQAGILKDWLLSHWLPEIQRQFSPAPDEAYLIGYSLGGLCALWLMLETGGFKGCASCSGSLWYDGWMDYMRAHPLKRLDSRVYLSLGTKEEKARNPRMAAVGDATRAAHALLQDDPRMSETALAWHDGGHFTDVTERIAQGILWLMRAEGRA